LVGSWAKKKKKKKKRKKSKNQQLESSPIRQNEQYS
jgi:hypothetical protein